MPACHTDRVALTILDREMYSEPAAARQRAKLEGGASIEEVSADFGLTPDAVRWEHSYELAQQAA